MVERKKRIKERRSTRGRKKKDPIEAKGEGELVKEKSRIRLKKESEPV